MAASPYKLSCSIYGHSADVRAVACTKDGKIISGSRDMTAKLWIPNELGSGYRETLTMSGHKNFVSCVCALPPNKRFLNGLIITGSIDKIIRIFDGVQNVPIKELNGHTKTVCKIVPGIEENKILSSSWDHTAKMWDLITGKVLIEYIGHEASVWAVIQLPCNLIATGSGDKKIKIWIKNGTCINTLNGHTDCVRDLAHAGPKEILSCSNDATIRHWQVELGQCLSTYYGHGHFIYSIAFLDSVSFVTSSEDHTVKVWNNGEVIETIPIPASTVWSVASLPNGDIVTGSNDGVVRVFSANPSRQAPAEEIKAYEEQVANFEKSTSTDFGGIKTSELPGEEALLESGTKDGQTKLIRSGNGVMAYSWSAEENKWNLIGNVTGSAGSENVTECGKPTYEGKEYDYVFSVDIEPGKPLLKLPYNKADDPWHAAQKFIHDNHLSQHFLEEVTNFIIRNSQQDSDQTTSSSDYVDPFTGGARYIPGESSGTDVANQNYFSGAPRHLPKTNISFITNSYFPQREFLRFDQANLNLILEKLLEFNKKCGDGNQIINDNQVENLVKICESGAFCRKEDIETLYHLLKWPEEMVFPVLDVMRLAIRNKEANNYLCNEKLIPGLMKFLSPTAAMPSNTMLALRVLTNMLSWEAGQELAERNKLKLLNIIENVPPPYNKPVQVAMATLLLNVAVLIRRSETPVARTEALVVTEKILSKLTDQEALLRAFVALGTLLVDTVDNKSVSPTFKPIIMKYQNDSSCGEKLQECCHYILQVLQ